MAGHRVDTSALMNEPPVMLLVRPCSSWLVLARGRRFRESRGAQQCYVRSFMASHRAQPVAARPWRDHSPSPAAKISRMLGRARVGGYLPTGEVLPATMVPAVYARGHGLQIRGVIVVPDR